MRTFVPLITLAALAACTPNELTYRSTLDSQTRGVALSDNGLDAHVGMIGTTCTIDTNWGCPTSDADLPSDEEMVLDHFRGDTLGSSPEAVHIIRAAAWQADLDIAVPGVKAAVLRSDGPMMVAGDATTCSLHVGGVTVAAPGGACADDASIDFDRDGGVAFVATRDGVVSVSDLGSESLAAAADLVSFDAVSNLVYVATAGDRVVQALRPDGTQAWSVQTDGPISSIAARGSHGQVLVMTEVDAFGQLDLYSGVSGDKVNDYSLPDAQCNLISSDNGGTVACQRGEDVNFYELDEGMEGAVIDDTPPENCINVLDLQTAD